MPGHLPGLGLAAIAVCALLVAGCSSGPSDEAGPDVPADDPVPAAAPNAPFAMDGTGCRELLVAVRVPLAQARTVVPGEYALLGEDTGQATAFAALKHCDDLRIDGVSIGPASTGDSGVFIDQGEPGVFHYYQAWWTTDNAQLQARLLAQGWNATLAGDTLSAPGALPATTAQAGVAWQDGIYALTSNVLGGSAPGENRAVGWQDTPNGTLTVDKALRGSALRAGAGMLLAQLDAARLFGPGSNTGVGLWNEYAMAGTVGPEP